MLQECLKKVSGRKVLSRWPKKRYKDTHKVSVKDFNIPTDSLEQAAQDRTKRHCLIKKEQLSMKQRESVTLKESSKNTKKEPRDQHQESSQYTFICSSLELKLA